MHPMHDNEIHINEMTLRVQGLSKEKAKNLGQDVIQHLSENPPQDLQNKRLETLNLNVLIPSGASYSEMSKLITAAIIKGLV